MNALEKYHKINKKINKLGSSKTKGYPLSTVKNWYWRFHPDGMEMFVDAILYKYHNDPRGATPFED